MRRYRHDGLFCTAVPQTAAAQHLNVFSQLNTRDALNAFGGWVALLIYNPATSPNINNTLSLTLHRPKKPGFHFSATLANMTFSLLSLASLAFGLALALPVAEEQTPRLGERDTCDATTAIVGIQGGIGWADPPGWDQWSQGSCSGWPVPKSPLGLPYGTKVRCNPDVGHCVQEQCTPFFSNPAPPRSVRCTHRTLVGHCC